MLLIFKIFNKTNEFHFIYIHYILITNYIQIIFTNNF